MNEMYFTAIKPTDNSGAKAGWRC